MLIPCNVHVVTTANDIRQLYAIYSHADINGQIKYIGVCPLSELFQMTDATANSLWHDHFGTPLTTLEIRVIALTASETEAYREQMRLINVHSPVCNRKGFYIDAKKQRVECIETGELFENAAAAARAHGVSHSALTNHLNRRAGHKTVKGRTYKRTMRHG